MHNFDDIKDLAIWMVNTIGKNKETALVGDAGADWDWVAAEVWNAYPGIVNEFLINDAIDFLLEVTEAEE